VNAPATDTASREHRVDEARQQEVPHHDLFKEAGGEQPDAAAITLGAHAPTRGDLRQQLVSANDGTGDQLREEGDEERVLREARRLLHVSPIEVDAQRDDLKAVEGDAERQEEVRHLDLEPHTSQRRKQCLHRHGGVLEPREQEERKADREREIEPAVFTPCHQADQPVVDADFRKQQQQVDRVPERVEEQAGGEQQPELRPARQRSRGQQQAEHEDREGKRVEEHQSRLPELRSSGTTWGASRSASAWLAELGPAKVRWPDWSLKPSSVVESCRSTK